MKKAIILLAIISSIALSFGIVNFSNIIVLKDHHVEKYEKYTYAYDCIMEAELQYWDYKHQLVNEVQNYITTIAPSSNLRGYAIVEECEEYNIDICFVLAQGEIESHFGTKGIAAKINSVFNVGIYDGLSIQEIGEKYKCDYPNESIEPYLKLLNERYLINKTEQDLMKKFVDKDGKRYASNPNYEIMVSERYKFITENTKIVELHNQVRSFAIKCGR
jgi:hypothetical protein